MKVLDLFSGIGGFSLGLERAGMETVAFCEIEPYPRKVLAKHWPNIPIYDDVRTLTKERLDSDGIGSIDVICGGFPCQDISTAGNQKGIEGERSGLWQEYARLISEIRPRYAIMENVAALLNGERGEWFGSFLRDLASIGYDAEWHSIPAATMGAPHGRDRVWIIAYPNHQSQPGSAFNDEAQRMQKAGRDDDANAKCRIKPLGWIMEGAWRNRKRLKENGVWKIEDSPIGMGMDDGIPSRMDRLRCLGNAVIPQIPELIGKAIINSLR